MTVFKKTCIILITLSLLLSCIPAAFAAGSAETVYSMPYYAEVDIANQITTIYSTEDNSIIRQMICTTGTGNLTPTSTYFMPPNKYEQDRAEWYYFPEFKIYAKYATRIINGILFHSILFNTRQSESPTWASNHALGSKASHGCIRLRVEDAKWISENCLIGTQVRIFDDGERNEDLRALLKLSTFSIDDDITYEEFLAGAVTLSRGAKLDSVVSLQEKLNDLGYDCGSADGDFGAKTEQAVRQWQRDYGYEEDGTVSPALMKTILAAQPTVTPEPTATPAPEEIYGDTAEVNVSTVLNIREQPNVSAKLLLSLPAGSEVTVISEEDGWSRVAVNGVIGYTSSNFLKITATAVPTPTPIVTPAPTEEPVETEEPEPIEEETEEIPEGLDAKVGSINSRLNVRSSPNSDSSILAKLATGTKITILERVGDNWAHIATQDGIDGYVTTSYLKYDKDAFEELKEEEIVLPEGIPMVVDSSDGLYLRREPNENGGVITVLSDNSIVYVQDDPEAEWVRVYAGGFTGYVLRSYLTEKTEEAA